MPVICECFEDLKWYNGGAPFGKNEKYSGYDNKTIQRLKKYWSFIAATGMFSRWTEKNCDDIFVGKHNDVEFDIHELKLIHKSKSMTLVHGGSGVKSIASKENSIVVFSGVVVKLAMNKEFKTRTIVVPDKARNFEAKNLKHTILEDPEFEKKFDVYTDDEVEARYLITPSFMTRLSDIQFAFKASSIRCAFYKNSLVIAAAASKDLFSIANVLKNLMTENSL